MLNSKNVNTAQKGFTLIELVVVIVILGILAVTAAPKFIDLTSDAKASVVQAVEGSLNSASDLAHAKALVAGTLVGPLSIANANITFENGYPDVASMILLMDIDQEVSSASATSDFVYVLDETSTPAVLSYFHGQAASANCVVTYTETQDSNVKPVITSNTTDC